MIIEKEIRRLDCGSHQVRHVQASTAEKCLAITIMHLHPEWSRGAQKQSTGNTFFIE